MVLWQTFLSYLHKAFNPAISSGHYVSVGSVVSFSRIGKSVWGNNEVCPYRRGSECLDICVQGTTQTTSRESESDVVSMSVGGRVLVLLKIVFVEGRGGGSSGGLRKPCGLSRSIVIKNLLFFGVCTASARMTMRDCDCDCEVKGYSASSATV